jgi:hypothetical protein
MSPETPNPNPATSTEAIWQTLQPIKNDRWFTPETRELAACKKRFDEMRSTANALPNSGEKILSIHAIHDLESQALAQIKLKYTVTRQAYAQCYQRMEIARNMFEGTRAEQKSRRPRSKIRSR